MMIATQARESITETDLRQEKYEENSSLVRFDVILFDV